MVNKWFVISMVISILFLAQFCRANNFDVPAECFGDPNLDVPNGFVDFAVPKFDQQMQDLQQLFYRHSRFGLYSTMWDLWLPFSVCWIDTENPALDQVFQREAVRHLLATRKLDAEGYVSTHQHRGLGHVDGWPFPLWTQVGGVGWHFSLKGVPYEGGFGLTESTGQNWNLHGCEKSGITRDRGLNLKLTQPKAKIDSPEFSVQGQVATFIVLEWWANGLDKDSLCYFQWTTQDYPKFSDDRKVYFSPPANESSQEFTMIPLYRFIKPEDIITKIRIGFNNEEAAEVRVQAVYTAVDTRHPINNSAYIIGCSDYLRISGDLNFLRDNINKIRRSMRYMMKEFQTEKYKCIFVPWWGHDGRSGIVYDKDGNKVIRHGLGIGNNYWDLLPCGGKDLSATLYYYDALKRLAEIEQLIADHPRWNIPEGVMRYKPKDLLKHAEEVRKTSSKIFWNPKTKRFVPSVAIDGSKPDYGLTFLNTEAIYYGIATDKQARDILNWMSGKRIVKDDTSQGDDIYHWRFAPRATTKRNIEYYQSVWSQPETIKWGYQVQDGGAVLGWSFYDMMSRLAIYGPDDAWHRLQEILKWYEDVMAEGGYRAYYSKPERGTMQGGGPPGGLGIDKEFYESVMLPQVMFYGFLGAQPYMDKLVLNPNLPSDWPQLTVANVWYQKNLLDITASNEQIKITVHKNFTGHLNLQLPKGQWEILYPNEKPKQATIIVDMKKLAVFPISLGRSDIIDLNKVK